MKTDRARLESDPPRSESTRHRPERADGPRRAPFVILVAALLGAGLAALLMLNTAAAADEVQSRQLTSDSADTQDQVTQLKIDIANKEAPSALASKASGLGMVPDPNPVFLTIAPDGSVSILGSAVKVTAAPPPAPSQNTATATTAAPPSPGPANGATPTPTSTATPAPTSPAPTSPAPTSPAPTSPAPTVTSTQTLPGGVR